MLLEQTTDLFRLQEFIRPRGDVVEGEHGVGLAAAKGRLELHYRVAFPAHQALQRCTKELAHPWHEIGALEEFHRLLVFGVGPAFQHLGQVCGELRLHITARGNIRVGRHGAELGRLENDYDGAQEAFRRALAIARREKNRALEVRTLALSANVNLFHLRRGKL